MAEQDYNLHKAASLGFQPYSLEEEPLPLENPFQQEYRPINVPETVLRLQAGDQTAAEDIYTFYAPRLFRYFLNRLPGSAEDLVQDTMMKTLAEVHKFEFRTEPGKKNDHEAQFGAWVHRLARFQFLSELKERETVPRIESVEAETERGKQYPKPVFTEETAVPVDLADLNRRLDQRLKEMLKPYELTFVQAVRQGLSTEEITYKHGITETSLFSIVSKARTRIEAELLRPAGFKRLKEYSKQYGIHIVGLYDAARSYGLETVTFLNMMYTTDEWMERYHHTRGHVIDQGMIEKGYILTHEIGVKEHLVLYRPKNKGLIRRYKGRDYVKQNDLEAIRVSIPQTPVEKTEEGYVYVRDVAASISEYRIIIKEIRLGRVKGVMRKNKCFIDPGELERFRITKNHAE